MTTDDFFYAPLMSGATASLYGFNNKELVESHFDELHELLVKSFSDKKFISKLKAMKGGAVLTVSIPVKPTDKTFSLVKKLWFRVKRSKSIYWEGFKVSMGVNLRKDFDNMTNISKIRLGFVALGTISMINDLITYPKHKEVIRDRLSDAVYRSIMEHTSETLSKL